jgi:hypothetical protein
MAVAYHTNTNDQGLAMEVFHKSHGISPLLQMHQMVTLLFQFSGKTAIACITLSEIKRRQLTTYTTNRKRSQLATGLLHTRENIIF